MKTPTTLAEVRRAVAVELNNAAYYRRSLRRGLMARVIAVPAIRDSLRMARGLSALSLSGQALSDQVKTGGQV